MAIEDATVAPSYKRGVGGKEEGLCLASSLAYVGTHRRRPFSSWKDWKGFVDLTDGSRFPWKTEGGD